MAPKSKSAVQHQASRKGDYKGLSIPGDIAGGTVVETSHSLNFDGLGFRIDGVLDNNAPGINVSRKTGVYFEKSTGFIIFSERLTSNAAVPDKTKAGWLRCELKIPPGSFDVVENGGSTVRDTHQIILKMHNTTLRLRDEDFALEQRSRVMSRDPKYLNMMQTYRLRDELKRARYIRIRFLKAAENDLLKKYVANIPGLLAGSSVSRLEDAIHSFHEELSEVMRVEDEKAQEQLAEHNRDNVTVVSRRFEGTPEFDLVTRGKWNIPHGQTVTIDGEVSSPLASQHAPRLKGMTAWVGQVQYRQSKIQTHRVTVKLLNNVEDARLLRALNQANVEICHADIRACDDDKQAEEIQKALSIAEALFKLEYGQECSDFNARSVCFVKIAHMLVDHPSNHANNWTPEPFELKDGSTQIKIGGFPVKPAMVRALQLFLEGRGGAAGLIGPPGTGKTTFIGVLVVLFLQQVKLKHNRIALSAHSNQATIECLIKTAAAMAKVGLKSDDGTLLHVESKMSREKRFGQNPDLRNGPLERYSLEATMTRIAHSYQNRFGAYLQGAAELKKYRKIDTEGLAKKYNFAKGRILTILRKRAKVICCTLGSLLHPFFLPSEQDKIDGRFEVDMLIIDEASQAPLPPILMAVEILNPRRVGFCGDDNQLPVHSKTPLGAQVMGGRSTLRRLEERGVELPMLDFEFRMPFFLYKPNSIMWYDSRVLGRNEVQTEAGMTLRKCLQKIEFAGDGVNFKRLGGHPGLVFDVSEGRMVKESDEEAFNPYDSEEHKGRSKYNVEEADFAKMLMTALVAAGVPSKYIMGLTGYQAQWDLLEQINSLPLEQLQYLIRKIDGCQGAEAMIVILSTVFTDMRSLGFMKSKQWLNVMTSRQKEALFHVCHLKTMQQDLGRLSHDKKVASRHIEALAPWVEYYQLFIEAQEEYTGRKEQVIFQVGNTFSFRVSGRLFKPFSKAKSVEPTTMPPKKLEGWRSVVPGPVPGAGIVASSAVGPGPLPIRQASANPAVGVPVPRVLFPVGPPPAPTTTTTAPAAAPAPVDRTSAAAEQLAASEELRTLVPRYAHFESQIPTLDQGAEKVMRDLLSVVEEKRIPWGLMGETGDHVIDGWRLDYLLGLSPEGLTREGEGMDDVIGDL